MSQPYPPSGSPFGNTPGNWPPQGHPPGPAQFGAYPPSPPPSNAGTMLLFIFGGLGVAVLLCCGSCAGLGFYTIQNEHREKAQQLQADYQNHPIVLEQLGGLDSVEGNLVQGLNDEDSDMVFDVRGPKGAATLHVSEVFGEIYSVVLRKDGQEWELMTDDEPTEDMSEEEAMVEGE